MTLAIHEHFSLSTLAVITAISAVLGLQIFLGILIIAGDFIFDKLGINAPTIYHVAKNQKMVVGLLIYVGGNFLKGYITRTTAFEVYVGETLVSSVLQNRAVLPLEDLVQAVMNTLSHNSAI